MIGDRGLADIKHPGDIARRHLTALVEHVEDLPAGLTCVFDKAIVEWLQELLWGCGDDGYQAIMSSPSAKPICMVGMSRVKHEES